MIVGYTKEDLEPKELKQQRFRCICCKSEWSVPLANAKDTVFEYDGCSECHTNEINSTSSTDSPLVFSRGIIGGSKTQVSIPSVDKKVPTISITKIVLISAGVCLLIQFSTLSVLHFWFGY